MPLPGAAVVVSVGGWSLCVSVPELLLAVNVMCSAIVTSCTVTSANVCRVVALPFLIQMFYV